MREGLCFEGTLLVCGALKRAAFDLLEMPQVIVFLFKVVLQETSGMLSSLGLNWGKGGGFYRRCCCVVHVSSKTVDVYFQAVLFFIVLVFSHNTERRNVIILSKLFFLLSFRTHVHL